MATIGRTYVERERKGERVFEAFFFFFFSASSLLIGAYLVSIFSLSDRVIGLFMGFGAGALISAVAFELVAEAHETAERATTVAFGIAIGALVFYAGDYLIERRSNRRAAARGESTLTGEDAEGGESEGAGAIVLGTVLDGIPESVVIGGSLVTGGGVSAAMVAAAFLSNMPEAIGATSGLERSGMSRQRVLGLWLGIVVISGLSALVGYMALEDASPSLGAFLQAFAAGSILTMLADSMMPEAFKKGGLPVGLATVIGFSLAFWISMS